MKRRRAFDEIDKQRHGKRVLEITVPSVHTGSGCRFGYTAKVDYETYDAFRVREQQKNKEELERSLRIKELREKDEITENKIRSIKRKQAKAYYENNKDTIQKKRKEKRMDEKTEEEKAFYALKAKLRRRGEVI